MKGIKVRLSKLIKYWYFKANKKSFKHAEKIFWAAIRNNMRTVSIKYWKEDSGWL